MTEPAPSIHFGTSGWRAVIAEEFTFANVRRAVQAIATYLKDQQAASSKQQAGNTGAGPSSPLAACRSPVVVGYDTRFLSPEFAQDAANLLANNGIPVLLSNDFVPTPVVSYSIVKHRAAGGINFTASHNPSEYNGLKFNDASGSPAPPEVTREIERLANEGRSGLRAEGSDNQTVGAQSPELPAAVRTFDPRPAYLAKLCKAIDVSALKKAKLRVGVDVLYGTGRGYLDTFLREAGCAPVVLHDWRDVEFGGQAPEPAESQLAELVRVMRQKKLAAGFGTDGDADRFGIVDQDGTLLSPNEILPIVLQHLVKTRRWKGLVVRSVMTSQFVDAVARYYGLPVKETPVGFKYIAEAMQAGGFLMGGEESGGLTIQGHVPEKDGILACLLMAEVCAVERKPFREILKALYQEVGPFFSERVNLHLSEEIMQAVRRRMETLTPNTLDGLVVKKIVRMDGFKFVFQDESWLGIRLSGTEPVVRLYLEAESTAKLKNLKRIGMRLIQGH
jgi:alpha-D-glucose phosphate-specific phosphoglucomutase